MKLRSLSSLAKAQHQAQRGADKHHFLTFTSIELFCTKIILKEIKMVSNIAELIYSLSLSFPYLQLQIFVCIILNEFFF